MPHFTVRSSNLIVAGPRIQLQIGIPAPLVALLKSMNTPAPPLLSIIAMVDTGSYVTCIAPGVLQTLGLRSTGSTTILTAGHPQICNLYDVALYFPTSPAPFVLSDWRVVAPPMTGHASVQCLIGRDILQRAVLTYIGPEHQFTLSF